MRRTITKFGLVLALLLLPGCVCFLPCPNSPSGWAWLGTWPANISITSKPLEEQPPPNDDAEDPMQIPVAY